MNTTEILDGIFKKQSDIGMTNQQFSDASNIPKATIERIKRGDTANPTMDTVLSLAAAVGYSFSNHPESTPAVPAEDRIKDPMINHMISVYESRGRSYEERIKRNTSHFNMLLAEKNRWLKFSLILNIILVVFICTILIYDVIHPDMGWIREQLGNFTTNGLRNYLAVFLSWFGV